MYRQNVSVRINTDNSGKPDVSVDVKTEVEDRQVDADGVAMLAAQAYLKAVSTLSPQEDKS
jgi:hypothetical protein